MAKGEGGINRRKGEDPMKVWSDERSGPKWRREEMRTAQSGTTPAGRSVHVNAGRPVVGGKTQDARLWPLGFKLLRLAFYPQFSIKAPPHLPYSPRSPRSGLVHICLFFLVSTDSLLHPPLDLPVRRILNTQRSPPGLPRPTHLEHNNFHRFVVVTNLPLHGSTSAGQQWPARHRQ